jgi:large subunit ribosomal protein L13
MKVYDAEKQILGRMASVIAKELLNGEKVIVVNCEKTVLAGNWKSKKEFYGHRYERGDANHGPFFPKQPEGIFRRTVRGMLPWDKTRGRNAYKNLRVYVGKPSEITDTTQKIAAANSDKMTSKLVTLGSLSLMIGAKKKW